jgi:hypothetical protein
VPEPLFTKDAINIGGHKLPLPLVAAVAAVAGVIVIWRAKSTASNVASVGAAPNPGGYDPNAQPVNFAPDPSAQLSNISSQLGALTSTLNSGPFAASSSTASASSSQAFTTPNSPQGLFAQLAYGGEIALQPSPGQLGGADIAPGQSLSILGNPVFGQQNSWWIPVQAGTQTGWVQAGQIRGIATSNNPFTAGAPVSSLQSFAAPAPAGLTPPPLQ